MLIHAFFSLCVPICFLYSKTGVRVRSFGPLQHGSHVWLLVQTHPDLGPLSCWLQKRSLAQFKQTCLDKYLGIGQGYVTWSFIPRLVGGLYITPIISGLTRSLSHVYHWGYNPLTGMGSLPPSSKYVNP